MLCLSPFRNKFRRLLRLWPEVGKNHPSVSLTTFFLPVHGDEVRALPTPGHLSVAALGTSAEAVARKGRGGEGRHSKRHLEEWSEQAWAGRPEHSRSLPVSVVDDHELGGPSCGRTWAELHLRPGPDWAGHTCQPRHVGPKAKQV